MAHTPGPYLIWSNEHRAWWNPEHAGYTINLFAAGRYHREDAIAICNARGYGWMKERTPHEIPVLEIDALDCFHGNPRPPSEQVQS